MFDEAAAAVEIDGGVAVVHFEMKDSGVVFAGRSFGEIQELCPDSLPAVGGLDKEFVNPRALAAVFEAVVKADHQIADGRRFFSDNVHDAIDMVLKKLGEIRAHGRFAESLRPGIVVLHVSHHLQQGLEIGEGGTGDGRGHKRRQNPLRPESIRQDGSIP